MCVGTSIMYAGICILPSNFRCIQLAGVGEVVNMLVLREGEPGEREGGQGEGGVEGEGVKGGYVQLCVLVRIYLCLLCTSSAHLSAPGNAKRNRETGGKKRSKNKI